MKYSLNLKKKTEPKLLSEWIVGIFIKKSMILYDITILEVTFFMSIFDSNYEVYYISIILIMLMYFYEQSFKSVTSLLYGIKNTKEWHFPVI